MQLSFLRMRKRMKFDSEEYSFNVQTIGIFSERILFIGAGLSAVFHRSHHLWTEH